MLARTVICYLLLLARLFQQSMRNALAALLLFMADDLGVSTGQKGSLMSAVAMGYLFTQVPGGALSEAIGTKAVVAIAMGLSATCCLALPSAADYAGISGVWWCMMCMGAVQGPLFPATTVVLSRWMPTKTADGADEKAWGTSQLDIGISIGALLIVPVATTLAEALGWRQAYHIIGGVSMLYVGLWLLLGASTPEDCWYISAAEREYLRKVVPKPSKKAAGGMPVRLVSHPALWAIFLPHLAFNFGAYFMTNWNPTYYSDVLKVSPSEARLHLAVPHVTNLASKALNPVLVKAADRSGVSLLHSRKLFTVLGLVGAALVMVPIPHVGGLSPWATTALFAAANTFFGLAPSGFKSNYLDVTVQHVGTVSGLGNTLGTVASYCSPLVVAGILEATGRWDLVMLAIAGCNAVAVAAALRWTQVTPIDGKED